MTVKLRAIEYGDLRKLENWRNDDRLRHTFRDSRLLNMLNQEDWFDRISRSREVEMFGIVDSSLIGVCGLCNINWVNRTAEVSRYLAPKYQSHDLAVEVMELLKKKAFKEFNLHRLWGEVYWFCEEKIAVLEQCGFVLEGRMHEHVYKQGKYHDSLIYGLLSLST